MFHVNFRGCTDERNPANQLRLVIDPILSQGLENSGDEFLPSTSVSEIRICSTVVVFLGVGGTWKLFWIWYVTCEFQ